MQKLFIAAALVATLFASGCSQRVADLTVASTTNVNMNSDQFIEGNRVEGVDNVPAVILPLGVPNVETAIDDATDSSKCVVGLADAVVDYTFFYLYFGFFEYSVTGTEIIDLSKPGCEDYAKKLEENVKSEG